MSFFNFLKKNITITIPYGSALTEGDVPTFDAATVGFIPEPSNGWDGSLIISDAATLTLIYGNDYVFSGTTGTWSLPPIDANILGRNSQITIKNRGTGNLTVVTNGGLNVIFTTGLTNTMVLSVGDAIIILPDGELLNIE